MNQLYFPHVETDLLATLIRRHKDLCAETLQGLEARLLTERDAARRIKTIEQGLKRLCRWN